MAVVELADTTVDARQGQQAGRNENAERLIFSEKFACPVSGFTISEVEPRLFSFNNPFGACPDCGGLGVEQQIDADLSSPTRTPPCARARSRRGRDRRRRTTCRRSTRSASTTSSRSTPSGRTSARRPRTPSSTAPATTTSSSPTTTACAPTRPRSRSRASSPISSAATRRPRASGRARSCRSISPTSPARPATASASSPRRCASRSPASTSAQCPRCRSKRAGEWFTELPQRLTAKQNEIAVRVLKEIRDRLKFLVDVGLEYLTLARGSGTLSGGESQRIRLASQIGSGLTGVLYVLDEPSIGLHQRDNARLLETLRRLRDLGNTVIVVEHDEDAIRTADHVLDIGPGAGIHGGHIIAQGQVEDLIGNSNSITGKYLSGELVVPIPERRPRNTAPRAEGRQRPRQQPQERHRRNSARPVHLRHRRLRRRQVDLADRHALQGARAQDQRRQRSPRPARPHRGPRAPRQDHRHRPVADRAHAALQPRDLHRRLHADPRVVRRPAGVQGARLRARPLLVQRQGRPLRGLPGRRRHQDRDALPARRLRHLRRLQGQALQPRDAGGAVQGQVDRRRARHDGRGGAGVLQGGAARARHPGAAAPRRPRLHPRRPAGDDAVAAARRSASSSPRN